jgi:ABC-type nitrate/sulfonate/bicarbonate transport system ATPase subunit
MIEIKHLTKTYPGRHGQAAVAALDNINLTVKEQEFVCLLGPSGCGKTTLLKIIGGLTSWDQGEVLIDGRPVTGPGRDRGMVFQSFALLPWADTLTNVTFGLELRGVPKGDRERIGKEWLAAMGLAGFEHRYPRDLSGGMQQRVGLARALAVDPKIMLMDEPFGALDAQTRRILQDDLLRIYQEAATSVQTVIFVTHSMEEAVLLADRVVVLSPRPGRLHESVDVPLPRPRYDGIEKDPVFTELKEYLWEQLKGMQVVAAEDGG